jgi:hypothetical protein
MSFQADPDTIEKKTGQTPRKVVAITCCLSMEWLRLPTRSISA